MTGKTLTNEQIREAAEAAGLEYAALKAVAAVESSGAGFLPDGRPKILFEGHIFWRELEKRDKLPERGIPAKYVNVLFKKWDKSKYGPVSKQHERLQLAAEIDREAALCSASWGLFQVMGFNWRVCGFESLRDFINAMYRDEAAHLAAAVNFIRSSGLLPALKAGQWAKFARGYNGAGYAANQYDKKLAAACAAARKEGLS